jgi:hypothetical protein
MKGLWASPALAVMAALVLAAGAAAAPAKPARPPALAVSVISATATGYTFHVVGTNYGATQPGGALEITCGGARGGICGPIPPPWIGGLVDSTDDGGSFFIDYPFNCGSNVKFAKAVDNDGNESKRMKAPC